MALAWFWGLYPPGQWVVIILVGMLVISIPGTLELVSEGEGSEAWRAFVIAPFGTLVLLIVWTVLLSIISVLQWLWGL
jgi:hypothetical protein